MKPTNFFGNCKKFSVKESLCAGVAGVYMAFFAEQVRNGELAAQMGFGTVLNKLDLTGMLF